MLGILLDNTERTSQEPFRYMVTATREALETKWKVEECPNYELGEKMAEYAVMTRLTRK